MYIIIVINIRYEKMSLIIITAAIERLLYLLNFESDLQLSWRAGSYELAGLIRPAGKRFLPFFSDTATTVGG